MKKGKKGDEFGDGEEDDTVETKTVRVSKKDQRKYANWRDKIWLR